MALIDPPLYVQADAHPARSFRAAITEMWDEGVLRWTNLKVVQRNAGAGGPNFTVDVGIGRAVIKGDSAVQQGNYMVTNDAVVNDASTVVTSVPTAGNHRKDLVILEMKDHAEDASGLNLARFRVIAGTPTAVANTPVVPTLPVSSIALAEIGPITNSTTTITDSIIVDRRTLAGRVCTPGTIEHLAGTHIPNGWLECAGQTVLRSAYPDLFAEIGTGYNTGGEAGTDFRLPLGRGRVFVPVLAGSAQVDTIGEKGGEYTHVLTAAEMASHSHGGATLGQSVDHSHGVNINTGIESANHTHGYNDPKNGVPLNPGFESPGSNPTVRSPLTSQTGTQSANHVHNVNGLTGGVSVDHAHGIAPDGSGTAHNVMQPYQVVGLSVIRAL